jgi:hypothetical protein
MRLSGLRGQFKNHSVFTRTTSGKWRAIIYPHLLQILWDGVRSLKQSLAADPSRRPLQTSLQYRSTVCIQYRIFTRRVDYKSRFFFETIVVVGSATLAPPVMLTWATLPWPVSTRIAVSFSYDALRRCVQDARYTCALRHEMHLRRDYTRWGAKFC